MKSFIILFVFIAAVSAQLFTTPKPPKCGENEQLEECGTACEPSCDVPEYPFCTEQCLVNVCQCKAGFLRDKNSKKCIKPSDCPKTKLKRALKAGAAPKCKKNEQLVECHDTCEPQCGFTPFPCTMNCIANTCDCKKGFVRNTNGECVEPLQCTEATSKCPKDEVFRACGTRCEPTCEEPHPKACVLACVMNKCQCDDGFVRHLHGCIKLSDCPKK
ncbi:unnamed protein product [Caenorhabditis angaria]|uniref:TIL domain-containing protein n=1 Tax=Caenorhabditis angaria TaxID=860376 RepID=A0A9P1IXV9_9PELO|nr:unnamed protein product [Caenorhabditis angaria]